MRVPATVLHDDRLHFAVTPHRSGSCGFVVFFNGAGTTRDLVVVLSQLPPPYDGISITNAVEEAVTAALASMRAGTHAELFQNLSAITWVEHYPPSTGGETFDAVDLSWRTAPGGAPVAGDPKWRSLGIAEVIALGIDPARLPR